MYGRKPGQPKKVNWAAKVASQIVPPMGAGFTGGFTPPGNGPMNIPNGIPVDLQSIPPMVGVPVRRKRRV